MFSNSSLVRIVSVLVTILALGACEREAPQEAAAEAEDAAVEVPAETPAEATTEPDAADAADPRRAVVSEQLPYAEVEDELVYGHFAFPEDMLDPLPGIIVIHEWWGLNDDLRAMADRLAGEGYVVLAVDLFGGKTATNAEDARKLMLAVVHDAQSARSNIRQAFEFLNLTAGAPSVGSLGFGFGGDWSFNAAMALPDELAAAVIYYGEVSDDEDKLRPVNVPILAHFAAEDRGIRVESVQRFERTLERLGKDYAVHVYPGVGHAFANPKGRNYDADMAADAWQRTLEFLEQNL